MPRSSVVLPPIPSRMRSSENRVSSCLASSTTSATMSLACSRTPSSFWQRPTIFWHRRDVSLISLETVGNVPEGQGTPAWQRNFSLMPGISGYNPGWNDPRMSSRRMCVRLELDRVCSINASRTNSRSQSCSSTSSDQRCTSASSTGPSKRKGSLPLSIHGHSSENARERIVPPDPRMESWICTSWPGLAMDTKDPMRLLVKPTARMRCSLSLGLSSPPMTR